VAIALALALPSAAIAQPPTVRAHACRKDVVSDVIADAEIVLTGRVLFFASTRGHKLSLVWVHESWLRRALPIMIVESWWETAEGDELLLFLEPSVSGPWREASLCAPNSSPPAPATLAQLGSGQAPYSAVVVCEGPVLLTVIVAGFIVRRRLKRVRGSRPQDNDTDRKK
jgi:hypothetical protein